MTLILKKSIALPLVTNDVPRATITLESSDLEQGCQRGDPCWAEKSVLDFSARSFPARSFLSLKARLL
jgi:hypothetical protein